MLNNGAAIFCQLFVQRSLSSLATEALSWLNKWITATPVEQQQLPDLDPFNMLFADLETRLAKPYIIDAYLKKLNSDEQALLCSQINPADRGLLNKQQVAAICLFLCHNRALLINKLHSLPAETPLLVIPRNKSGQRAPYEWDDTIPLPRKIVIEKLPGYTCAIYVLIQSKNVNNDKVEDRKFIGTTKTVTFQVLLNPSSRTQPLIATVSKKEVVRDVDGTKITYIESIEREHTMINSVYGPNYIKRSPIHLDTQGRSVIRSIEPAALCDLAYLQVPEYRTAILTRDVNYEPNNADSIDKIITRLIGDILQWTVDIHAANIINSDIKCKNVLIYIDEQGLVRARIVDFNLSAYNYEQMSDQEFDAAAEAKDKIWQQQVIENSILNSARKYQYERYVHLQESRRQLTATSIYASPQVVGFTLQNDKNKLKFATLAQEFKHMEIFGVHKYFTGRLYEIDCRQLRRDAKDEMFSVGIMLFILITGYYPTLHLHLHAKRLFPKNNRCLLQFMHYDTAVQQFPLLAKCKPLLDGLLQTHREPRFSSTQALAKYQEITQGITIPRMLNTP